MQSEFLAVRISTSMNVRNAERSIAMNAVAIAVRNVDRKNEVSLVNAGERNKLEFSCHVVKLRTGD